MADDCPFCEIVAGRAPATFVYTWSDALAFVPLNPVVEGHTLVVPRVHVTDFAADPEVSAATMRRAAEAAHGLRPDGPMNLITSWGAAATQSVFHLHLHLVPRTENDGLALPWYSGRSKRGAAPAEPRPAGASVRLGRIAQAHSKHLDEGGATSGDCVECGERWPCPTYTWATEDRDALATWDPADDEPPPPARVTVPCSWAALKRPHLSHSWQIQPGMRPELCDGYPVGKDPRA